MESDPHQPLSQFSILAQTKSYRAPPSKISFLIEVVAPQKNHLKLRNETSGRYTYIAVHFNSN